MKTAASYYVADESTLENQCKYRIQKLPFSRGMSRSAISLPLTDTLFVVERKMVGSIWMKKRQFATIQEAENYVSRKATLVGA